MPGEGVITQNKVSEFLWSLGQVDVWLTAQVGQDKSCLSLMAVIVTYVLTFVTAAATWYYLQLPATPMPEMHAGRSWRQRGQEEQVGQQATRDQVPGH